MRRKDREVTDFDSIVKIIDECEIIRIGLSDGEFPYIVPMNFGYTVDGNRIKFYVHGAPEGRKIDLIRKSGKCSFEMDCCQNIRLIPERKQATMDYRSVMGTADVNILEDDEKKKGLDILMNRYTETRDFEYDSKVIPHTAVFRLDVIEISAKKNG